MKSPDKCIIEMKTQLSSIIILNVKVQVIEIARSGLTKAEMIHNFCLHGAAPPLSSQKIFEKKIEVQFFFTVKVR